MTLKTLAESIILQSVEDIGNPLHRAECLEFFQGNRFKECARIAGMTEKEKCRLLLIVKKYAAMAMEKISRKDARSKKSVPRPHPINRPSIQTS